MSSPSSQPGTAVTKADVREAAMTLFAERGYHGTSLKQIAELLGLRTPSLYNHMVSKASLLDDIVMSTLAQVVDDFERVLEQAEGPLEQFSRATEVYALHHATHRRETLIVNQDTTSLEEPTLSQAQEIRRTHERRYRQIIIDGCDAGAFSVESPMLASFAIREMCVSVARWFRADGLFSAEQVARQYRGYALRVVGATEETEDTKD